MADSSKYVEDPVDVAVEPFPERLSSGTSVLIAGPVDPTRYVLGLRALCRFGAAEDSALVVTTNEGAGETASTYEGLSGSAAGPALAYVDTVSERQNLTAVYEERPVVYVTTPGDLERIVIGLSDLTGTGSPSNGTRHLLIRSLTPILNAANVEDVRAWIDRIVGMRTAAGMAVLGLDYTAHSEEVVSTLAETVDGVIWFSGTPESEIRFEYRPAVGRYNRRA